jgi:hypothetical protein
MRRLKAKKCLVRSRLIANINAAQSAAFRKKTIQML